MSAEAIMNDGKIACRICGARVHSIAMHLKDAHPAISPEAYQADFPGAPMFSEVAKQKMKEIAEKRKASEAEVAVAMAGTAAAPALTVVGGGPTRAPFHELFGLDPTDKDALSSSGKAIPILVCDTAGPDVDMIPAVDPEHVFDVNLTKNLCMGVELGMPVYVWGHAGTGKTTLLKQIAARTRRPMLRVQHSINTEEAHIIGQWTAKGGETIFQLGPLAQSMLNGWFYCADEYDFALPAVLSVYQAVLEGEPLVIKDAPPEYRIIKPHPNFRFGGTGNTNGSGDETGLYQGTQIQNAANYERFGIVEQCRYMPAAKEVQIIVNKAKIAKPDAEKLVDFATRVREAYDKASISATVSPRALVNAGKLGLRRASFRIGLNLAFINRLSKVDREAVDGIAQRIFGESK